MTSGNTAGPGPPLPLPRLTSPWGAHGTWSHGSHGLSKNWRKMLGNCWNWWLSTSPMGPSSPKLEVQFKNTIYNWPLQEWWRLLNLRIFCSAKGFWVVYSYNWLRLHLAAPFPMLLRVPLVFLNMYCDVLEEPLVVWKNVSQLALPWSWSTSRK